MEQGRLLLLAVLSLVLFVPLLHAATPEGAWITVDDKTGKKRAVIRMQVSGDTLTGTVVETFPDEGEEKSCVNCPGEFKNKPIKGLTIIWGMKAKGENIWEDGQILDPKSGKIYRAKMKVEGDKLHVRGFIGFSLLGRSQTWIR